MAISPSAVLPFRSRLRVKAGNALRVLTMALGLSTAHAPAQSQSAVPQHWINYAQLVGNQFQAWLADPAQESAQRLHAQLQARAEHGEPTAPIVMRVWIGLDGRVERAEFNSLGDLQTDTDLRGVLMAQPLSEPPPRDMKQPLIMQLNLQVGT
ncbi:YbaB/EbfC family DNA-binding protein [Achromobacter pestifer]|uniref:YbaB/EbfC family DNA-binding protein n=1 Tax=Achromobacter pestifer TaxID=1353889 RepID=A0A6S7A8L1_9BURK|nr:YbaB/EbfC family DNA-binding protein [Achromobacter pestifer]CAB3707758.1 hypothetical protein LMG3431_05806 [Achromobacter pestifer]